MVLLEEFKIHQRRTIQKKVAELIRIFVDRKYARRIRKREEKQKETKLYKFSILVDGTR